MQLNYEFDRQLELERADAREEGREEGREDNEYQDKLLRENGLVSDVVLKKSE